MKRRWIWLSNFWDEENKTGTNNNKKSLIGWRIASNKAAKKWFSFYIILPCYSLVVLSIRDIRHIFFLVFLLQWNVYARVSCKAKVVLMMNLLACVWCNISMIRPPNTVPSIAYNVYFGEGDLRSSPRLTTIAVFFFNYRRESVTNPAMEKF